jgi:quercetin dioxygenase-like cupin family protein
MKHPKVWGEEDWIVNNPSYCGKILRLRQGWQCSLHYHPVKAETFYVMEGRVRFELGHGVFELKAGESITVEPRVAHRFTGLEDSLIVEFSTFHDEADVVRLEVSRAVDG